MNSITGSLVLYNNKVEIVQRTINSFLNTALPSKLYVIDNSNNGRKYIIPKDKRVEYIFNRKNVGYGAGNNIAIRRMIGETKYSLILNPDVYFNRGVLEKLFTFMEDNEGIGCVMPKVLYPDGSLQRMCRLLPNPHDLVLRKINHKVLSPLVDLITKYELRSADFNSPMDAPYLSGCFMFVRTGVFKKIGIFDERFFVYFEDVDLSRRINKLYRTAYYPEAVIYHGYERATNRDIAHFKHIISSGVKYFNKWGWFFDSERRSVNKKTIRDLKVL